MTSTKKSLKKLIKSNKRINKNLFESQVVIILTIGAIAIAFLLFFLS